MPNFIQNRKTSFRFDNKPEGMVTRLEVYYSKGGMNYWNYKMEPRGIYVSITQIKIEQGVHFRTESYTVGQAGYKTFIQNLERFNVRKLKAVADKMEAQAANITAAYELDKGEGWKLLKQALGIAEAVEPETNRAA